MVAKRPLVFLVVIFYIILLLVLPRYQAPAPDSEIMMEASRRMEGYIQAIANHRKAHGPAIDVVTDPNRTGVIGIEFSPITTTIGNLEAKRTVTNPNFAALFVQYFHQLGLKPGDSMAVGASGSFPGAILAMWAASESYGLDVSLITSIGSSTWGGNNPDFTYLDMERILQQEGLLSGETALVSLGGHGDMGNSYWPGGMEIAEHILTRNNYPLIDGDDVQATRQRRIEHYQQRPPKLYINIGGGGASLGSYPWSEQISPGLNRFTQVSQAQGRGLVHHYLSEGIPVVHILDIHYLANRYGLPIDPVPLPAPGNGSLYTEVYYHKPGGLLLFGLTIMSLILICRRKQVTHPSKKQATVS